ncbi:MAG: hypothetical protein ABI794_06260 [Betaproteobacteria bacterium]
MKMAPTLLQRAIQAVRVAMVTSAVAGVTMPVDAATPPQARALADRLAAVRQALSNCDAATADAGGQARPEAPLKVAQWPNGSGFRNGGWRNY